MTSIHPHCRLLAPGGGYLFDYQVIIIDDGSTDNTPAILDEYKAISPLFKVFHIRNSGAAKARKYGIDNSNSDYLAFCDSDDYVSPDWLLTLYEHLEKNKADFVLCGAYINDNNLEKEYSKPYKVWVWNQDEAIEKYLEHKHLNGVLWTNLFKRNLFENLEWRFDITIGEDAYLIWQILSKVEKVAKILAPKYHYMMNEGSLTNREYNHQRFYSMKVLTEFIVNSCLDEPKLKYLERAKEFQYRIACGELYAMVASDHIDKEAELYFVKIIRAGGLEKLIQRKGLKKKLITMTCAINPFVARLFHKSITLLKHKK